MRKILESVVGCKFTNAGESFILQIKLKLLQRQEEKASPQNDISLKILLVSEKSTKLRNNMGKSEL